MMRKLALSALLALCGAGLGGAALAAVYGGQKKAETWLKGLKDGPVVVEVCGGAIVDRGVLEAYAKQFGIEE